MRHYMCYAWNKDGDIHIKVRNIATAVLLAETTTKTNIFYTIQIRPTPKPEVWNLDNSNQEICQVQVRFRNKYKFQEKIVGLIRKTEELQMMV